MPDRYFIAITAALALLFTAGPPSARAQQRPGLTISAGPAFYMKPHWFTAGNGFIRGAAPTGSLQLEWPTAANERLHFLGFVRNGWWATEAVSRASGYDTDWAGAVYQLGGGLRYTDFVNLGRWLEPFAGLTASAGYVQPGSVGFFGNAYAPLTPDVRRFTVLLGAELGVQAWVSPSSGPVLTLEVYRSLRRYCPPYLDIEYLQRPDPLPPLVSELRVHALRGQAALLLGWHWQLGAGTPKAPRQRGHTPRYSEPPAEPADETPAEDAE
jgi:hypothetical protein